VQLLRVLDSGRSYRSVDVARTTPTWKQGSVIFRTALVSTSVTPQLWSTAF
jgi:hypothetical protein